MEPNVNNTPELRHDAKPIAGEGLFCPECNSSMEQTDTVHSNINTRRATVSQSTGNIYTCTVCEIHWLENYLNKSKLEAWSY